MYGIIIKAMAIALLLVLVTACGGRTKEDIIERTRDISTRAELERVLGRPNDIAKLGPVEQWTYKASNGEVVFIIVGDTVTLQAAGSSGKKQE